MRKAGGQGGREAGRHGGRRGESACEGALACGACLAAPGTGSWDMRVLSVVKCGVWSVCWVGVGVGVLVGVDM